MLAGRHEHLLSTVKRCKLSWFGHVYRHGTLHKIVPQGVVDGSRHTGRLDKSLKDNAMELTGQSTSSGLHIADDSSRRAVIATEVYVGVPNDA